MQRYGDTAVLSNPAQMSPFSRKILQNEKDESGTIHNSLSSAAFTEAQFHAVVPAEVFLTLVWSSTWSHELIFSSEPLGPILLNPSILLKS